MGKICTFFCQEDVSLNIEPLIEKQIRKLVTKDNVNTFRLLCSGWFSIYVIAILKRLKMKYPNIQMVTSDILKSQEIENIIRNTHYIITYISKKDDETTKIFKIAHTKNKNIINLVDCISVS